LYTLPQHGDGYNAYLDGYAQAASLAFLDVSADINGDIVISLDGNAPFVQGIRLTSLGEQSQMQADAVPEPSTLVGLGMLALAGLFWIRRRLTSVLMLLVVVALSGSFANAQVTDNYFLVANGDFETTANWSYSAVPGNVLAENNHIHIGSQNMLNQTCNFSGTGSYVLTNPSLLTLGEGPGSIGTLNITGGGLLSVAGQVVLDFTDPGRPYSNHQPLYIGHNAGQGYLNVDNGMFCATQWDIYVGNSPYLGSSQDGSYGEINVGENGTLHVGYDSTGAKITTPFIRSDGSTGNGYAALMMGCGDIANRGVLNVNGGVVKSQGVYLSYGHGYGDINVRGDSSVSLGLLTTETGRPGSRTVSDSHNQGAGTIRAIVKDGAFNPIVVENRILFSGPFFGHGTRYNQGMRGGTQFDMDFEGTAPAIGNTFTVIDYSTTGTGWYIGGEFNFGSYFVNEDGYGIEVSYGDLSSWTPGSPLANSAITASVVATSSELLQLNLGTANSGVAQNTYGKTGLNWNDIGEISGTATGLEMADGDAASGVTVTLAGIGSKATMPMVGWDDVVESTPDEVMNTRVIGDANNAITVTIGGLDPAGTFNVEIFGAEETPTLYSQNLRVNNLFANDDVTAYPEQGNWYSPYTDCYAQGAGLNFYSVTPDANGDIIITVDGYLGTLIEAIRLTDLDATITSDIPGDANHDKKVDASDATILAGNWQAGPGATWEMGDFNGDGHVDASDATILAGNWQAGTGNTAVPEPSTIMMICSALGLLWFFKRRK
jgi:hypothetical protein